MPQIEIRENKTLKLTNVLSRKIPETEFFSQNKQAQMLLNWVNAKGYEVSGPLITYSSGVKGLDADKKPIINNCIMVQLKQSNINVESSYCFDEFIRIENCLYARFNDKSENLQYVTMKLQVFAYENEIKLTSEVYMVLIDAKENSLLADVFMPIRANGNREDG